MTPRIEQELELIRKHFPNCEVKQSDGLIWVKIPGYKIPTGLGWNKTSTDVAFHFPIGYPGVPPYGLYVACNLLFNNNNVLGGVSLRPPFDGEWGLLSWTFDDTEWKSRLNPDIVRGINMLNFIHSFSDRFKEGA